MFRSNLNLTGRILISFWGTLILIIAILSTLFFIEREQDEFNRPIPPIKINDQLVRKLLTEQYNSVQDWFKTLEHKETRRVFVVREGQEILQRPLPPVLHRINRRLSSERPFIHHKRFGRVAVGRMVELPNEKEVRILMLSHPGGPGGPHLFKHNWFVVILTATLISGIISYMLARYISKPIIHLRKATQNIAAGDLSIRVKNEVKTNHGEVYLLAKDFDKMAERLDRTISSHKHLIQDISHELRSPVARLQLALELAKKRLDIQDDQPDILRIEKECENINAIINTLLNLPAYELDPQLALQDEVDIADLVQQICEDLNFNDSQPPIQYRQQGNQPCIIQANQQLLRSAFENVLKNAQHYHEGDEAIDVELMIQDEWVCIQCRDKGQGIPPSHIEQIFKPFYRISEARDRASGGYGLGLAITKRAVDLHGGKVSAENHIQGGLLVKIELPLSPVR